jgi:pyridoxine kinase
MGPRIVVITSLTFDADPDTICIYGSECLRATTTHMTTSSSSSSSSSFNHFKMKIPRRQVYFSGTGDLFTALLLAWLHRHPLDLKAAMEKVVASIQAVLERTSASQTTRTQLIML